MKVCAFYVTKKQRVIEERDVAMVLEHLAKAGASAFILTQITPILTDLVGTPIVAQASTFSNGVTNGALTEGTDKILGIANEIITSLQKIAEPVAYAFCVKGILEKMSGQENVGSKHMKEALKGYVVIQVLPMIFDMINVFR
jgi:hypothetical protein